MLHTVSTTCYFQRHDQDDAATVADQVTTHSIEYKQTDYNIVHNMSIVNIGTVGPVAQLISRLSYGLDGPASNPGGDENFRPSIPALGPTQPPVKWVPGLSRGVKSGRGVLLTTHPPSSAAVMGE